MKDLIRRFENPGSEYRGKPFWAWNGKLKEPELRRQIRVMKHMGFGGFFMHSRVGLATPYLSEGWFDLVRACIDEAGKWKMEAWLYDEDRWPSGAAGGLVTKEARYRQRHLRLAIHKPSQFNWDDEVLCAFTGNLKGAEVHDLKPLTRNKKPGSAGVVLAFRRVVAEPSPWFNGATYLDTLSQSAVNKFIQTTHEKYAETIGTAFGNTVPGIFTDEPNYGRHDEVNDPGDRTIAAWDFPWTDSLPRFFEEKYGYSIIAHLPELFFDVEGVEVSKARHHYHDCITEMFVTAFAKSIGDWCASHNMLHTGHVLCEESLTSQTFVVGSAMRFYEHMQAPGIDNLMENNYEFDTAKQCASVVRQTGKKWMLSELYGCTGWDFPFEGHKADGNWQAVLGVNLRCPHLSWYTMLGQAKRDYPASIFFQSPWWKYYAKVEDYFARINVILSQGKSIRSVLVIHPLESAWVRFRADWRRQNELKELDEQLTKLRNWLLEAHLDFDYGDEDILSRTAGVTAGPSGALMAVGQAAYHVVVVPPLITIRATTLRLLRQFAEKGGLVVFAGGPPGYVNTVKDREAKRIAEQCVVVSFSKKELVPAIEERGRSISICDADDAEVSSLFYQLREDADGWYLFVVNNDRRNAQQATIKTTEIKGPVEEWDPETGTRWLAEYESGETFLKIALSLPPTGSRLFVIKKNERSNLRKKPKFKKVSSKSLGKKRWSVLLDEPNVLVLDSPQFRIGDGKLRGPTEILRVDQDIRKKMELPLRGGQMVQPWARKPKGAVSRIPVELLYSFRVDTIPSTPVDLAIERPERFEIRFNGFQILAETDSGWWTDPCLRRLPLAPHLFRPGENKIELRIEYGEDDGLESVFLLGDFGVRLRKTAAALTEGVRALTLGDWTKQGLPFYSAAVSYLTEFTGTKSKTKRTILKIADWDGCCVRVLLNGSEAGVVAWEPYEIDITEHVKSGKNDLRIEVISSRRNAFGPLHQSEPGSPWTGPDEFITTGKRWTDSYNLRPYGLYSPPVVEIREQIRQKKRRRHS